MKTEPALKPPYASLRVPADRVTADVPTAEPEQDAGTVWRLMHGSHFEDVGHVVVLEENQVFGLVPLEALILADSGWPLGEVMRTDPPAFTLASGRDDSAPMGEEVPVVVDTREGCLVVNDERGEFRGLVPSAQMLSLLVAEHDEDLARIGGYLAGAGRARTAAYEPVGRRLWHRLPWLLIGLLGAMGSALLMGAFDHRLEENVLIALFVPAIVYMADAVGTQTETVLIRALAVGVRPITIIRRELVTGAIIGTLVGTTLFAFAALGWGDARVALAVGLALLASSTIATGVAMVLPSTFQHFGIDPAFGSGPLATVVQDLLSIATYFAVVVLVVP